MSTNGEIKKEFAMIITPEKQIEFDQFLDRNIPPFYCRLIAAFISTLPQIETIPDPKDGK